MLMDRTEIHHRVLGICRDILGDQTLEIEDSHLARDIPGYDSLTHIQILIECQRVFQLKLTALEAGQIGSFGEMKELIWRKLA
jgi:acyl carrier protein